MDRKTRRFGLGDLMILMVAIATLAWSLRGLWQGLTAGPGAGYWRLTPSRLMVAATLSACATPLTLACLAFRLRRPRPAWRRVAIQPGTAALVACLVTFFVQTVEVAASLQWPDVAPIGGFAYGRASSIRFGDSAHLVLIRSHGGNGLVDHIEPLACHGIIVASFALPCGSAVAAVWMVLALSGRWHPEKSWIDRFGRVLGVSWILISILTALPV